MSVSILNLGVCSFTIIDSDFYSADDEFTSEENDLIYNDHHVGQTETSVLHLHLHF